MIDISQTFQELLAKFIEFLPSLITALVVFVLSLFLAGVISRALYRALKLRDTDPEIALLLNKVTRWSIIILGTTVALGQVNFNLTAFLTGLGIVGFTIGFAIQDVSKNFVAGLLLLLQQPFDIGENIEVAGFTGTVLNVDLRATDLLTLDGRLVMIPNADVFTNPIVNLTRPTRRRIEIQIGVAYESDLDEVREVALDAIGDVDGLLAEPDSQVMFHTFGGTTVDFTLFYWIDTKITNPNIAKDQGLASVKKAFEASGIEMPFPTQTVLLQQ